MREASYGKYHKNGSKKPRLKRLSIHGAMTVCKALPTFVGQLHAQRLSPINAGKSHGITPPNGSTVPNGFCMLVPLVGKKLCPNGHGIYYSN